MARPAMFLLVLFLGILSPGAPLCAQQENWSPDQPEMSRTELTELVDRLDQAAQSSSYSGELRERARQEAALVRDRLAKGDFQVGDKILLSVEGEQALNDTFTVRRGGIVSLPVADVSLAGVLHSELEKHLTTEIGKYVRNPAVQARSLVRLFVLGRVLRPGSMLIPADTPLPDVLMLAGGPGPDADISKVRVMRGNEPVLEGEEMHLAMSKGRTIDQLSFQAGDEIHVPAAGGFDIERAARIFGLLVAIPISIYGLTQLF